MKRFLKKANLFLYINLERKTSFAQILTKVSLRCFIELLTMPHYFSYFSWEQYLQLYLEEYHCYGNKIKTCSKTSMSHRSIKLRWSLVDKHFPRIPINERCHCIKSVWLETPLTGSLVWGLNTRNTLLKPLPQYHPYPLQKVIQKDHKEEIIKHVCTANIELFKILNGYTIWFCLLVVTSLKGEYCIWNVITWRTKKPTYRKHKHH